jgi:hypothetical protein
MYVDEFELPIPVSLAYAYSPRERTGSRGRHHIQTQEDFVLGRLKRKKGDALCRPAKKFWNLDTRRNEHESHVTCLHCLGIATVMASAHKETT